MKISDYINEIAGSDYYLDQFLIVGPYPTDDFIGEVLDNLPNPPQPTHGPAITILVDDGWSNAALQLLNEKINERRGRGRRQQAQNLIRVKPAEGSRLVHVKLYFCVFKTTNNERLTKRYLLLGSANASAYGLGEESKINAESYISLNVDGLEKTTKKNLLKYLNGLAKLDPDLPVEGVRLSFGENIGWMNLPGICAVEEGVSKFDAWLRRGKMCNQYPGDPSFGKVMVKLKAELPRNEIEIAFGKSGFNSSDSKDNSVWVYLPSKKPEADVNGKKPKNEETRWSSRYFVIAKYGLWTSETIYRNKGNYFKGANHKERLNALNFVLDNGGDAEFKSNLGRRLLEDINALVENEKEACKFFDVNNNGASSKYMQLVNEAITRDFKKSSNKEYQRRFVDDFEFFDVPQLSNEFDSFAESFCESLLQLKLKIKPKKNQKPRSPLNVFAKILFGKDSPALLIDDPRILLAYLRENWEETLLRQFEENKWVKGDDDVEDDDDDDE